MIVKRLFDLVGASFLIVATAPVQLLAAVAVRLTSPGPLLYWSDRVGQHNHLFRMPKFRTMVTQTPELATHLLVRPDQYLTPIGSYLRRFSIDELPQLFSVISGHMSLVGPRPALWNQEDLICERTRNEVHRLRPGITGWAQVNGRDELSIQEKVTLDAEYLNTQSFRMDLLILFRTLRQAVRSTNVSH